MTSSRLIESKQTDIHPKLDILVRKHLCTEFSRPIAKHTYKAFEHIEDKLSHAKLIFDTGCGNGQSTLFLAQQFPNAYVIGIDKSIARLKKHVNNISSPNYTLVQANLTDFWRLAVSAKITLWRHYFLYPNPWPKAAHVQRRWHGSAVFPAILALGGTIELRSNWLIYAKEFQRALKIADRDSWIEPIAAAGTVPISPFEEKYLHSGHTCWRLLANTSEPV